MAFRDEDIAEELAQFDPWERQTDGLFASLVRMGRQPKVTKAPNVCAVCPNPLKQAVEGRSRIYCSRVCKDVADRKARKARSPTKPHLCATRHACAMCPKPIERVAVGGHVRVYCSRACNERARRQRKSRQEAA